MSFHYLPQPRIHELFAAFTDAGMVRSGVLDSLLEGLSPAFASSLPDGGQANARLLTTLQRLNTVERLTDGSVPFSVWLQNAASLAAAFPKAAGVVLRALADVSARAAGAAPEPGFRDALPGKEERIVHRDDMLPFAFLRGGVEAGRAVARLQVTRVEGGKPALDAAGEPRRYRGTGWLLTRSLIITNHHVIVARLAEEPPASIGDLELQARSVVAEFDYDEKGAVPTEARVARLEAFSPHTGPLDYAILRLEAPVDVGRRPLRVSRAPFALPADPGRYPAVNIIQHPEGAPKRVACRNNLVTRVQGTDLWYFTDTMAGSSGSPVFDDRWQVVALHKKWDHVDNVMYQGKTTAWANVGTLMSAVLDDLGKSGRQEDRALLDEILRANQGG
ncbi:trypsin-like peptidase domain-containing protein [Sorangium cellulosum]|uniref:Effector-associated domain-containing protein n=1 Tax=Sorangium cellulosum So0157-2 TaxID=1254432 RepID=S4XWU1_SORCE|nr:trypsin-like peptidase domain-containing protein [Sorangium cellulosum]AGP37692.1 hypothetical protein SCE1572_26375 [Sorangium cellulosum So0157-2]